MARLGRGQPKAFQLPVNVAPTTADLTTAGLSVDATVTEAFTVTAALTTAGLSASATATETFAATAALTTAGLSVAATDAEVFTGTAALTVAGLSVAATATESVPSTAALTTAGLSVAATATEVFATAADLTTAGLSVAATDAEVFTATVAATTAGLSASAAVEVPTPAAPTFSGGGSKAPRRPKHGVTWAPAMPQPPKAPTAIRVACAVGGLGCEIAMSTRWRFEAETITDDELRELVELVGA